MEGVHRAGRNWSTIKGKMYDGVRMSNSIPEGEKIASPTWAPVHCDGTTKFPLGCCRVFQVISYRHFKKKKNRSGFVL